MAYPNSFEHFQTTFETEILTPEEQKRHNLMCEFLRLREFNRIVMDVFWSAARLAKACKCENSTSCHCDVIAQLPHLLEERLLKEPDVCPENYRLIMKLS